MAFHLRPSVEPFVHQETQLFGYLACLLFLYSGHPVADWGYSFVATPSGAPFSEALDAALKRNLAGGFLERDGELYTLTSRGEDEYRELSSLSLLASRDRYIEAASSSSLAIPAGVVGRAISQDPDIHAASELRSRRPLLDDTALAILSGHFESLREALGPETHDLLAPSLVWLRYMYRQSLPEGTQTSEGEPE